MAANYNPITLPRPERLPEVLRPTVVEYLALVEKRASAEREYNDLIAGTEQARHADAAALGQAARDGSDLAAVGTPAQDALRAKLQLAETKVRGLTEAVQAAEIDVRTALREHVDAGIAYAREAAERAQAPYLAAIEQIERAAAEYDATAHTIAGWEVFAASGGSRVAWGREGRGTLVVRGKVYEPVRYGEMTATLRRHTRRHLELLAAIDLARDEKPESALPPGPADELAATGSAVW